MQRGEHLARVLGLAVIGGGLLVAPVAPAAGEEPPEVMWGRLFGGSGDDYSRSVALDADGNLIICGTIGHSTVPNDDAFLAKYTSVGSLLWSQQLGTAGADAGRGVAADSAGNIYIVGSTGGALFGPSAGGRDCFLAKYDAQGALLWGRQFGTSWPYEEASAVVVDLQDNVYILSAHNGQFIARYDPEGSLIWERELETGNWVDLAVDASGDVLIGGYLRLARYTPAGDELWMRQFDKPISDEVWIYDMAVDAAGNVFFAGEAYDGVGSESDSLLLKFDGEGTFLWSRQRYPGYERMGFWWGVVVDAVGNAYVAGGAGPAFIGEGGITPLWAKYDPSGDECWLQVIPIGARNAMARSIVLDSAGNLFGSGWADRLFGIPGAGGFDAFVARFRPACYADCDGSGATDFFDFLCFQNLLVAGDIRADCDDNGVMDFLDFLCFQDAFAAGCPE